jgi:predicted dehydrogenase
VSHIATFGNLSEYFQITYLCDVSQQALDHCAKKVHGAHPKVTKRAGELCSSSEVDAVFVASATAFHTEHAILALRNNKPVLVEKPLCLCYRDIEAIEAAEKQSSAKLFVGYMRRYAPAFLQAIAEVENKAQIQYARVRGIIGWNSFFVDQSGTFPKSFSDISKEDIEAMTKSNDDVMTQALLKEFNVPMNPETIQMLNVLGGLGSHDLSAMREALGMPNSVLGARLKWPIWSALLNFDNFAVTYESGMNNVPVFDAQIEIYTPSKIVRVNYDSPYVRGLPTTMTIREKTKGLSGEDSYQERTIRVTYEDSYTVELKNWYDSILTARPLKTTIADAREDVDIFKMLMQAGFGKSG